MTSSEKLNDSEGSCLVPSPRNLQRRTARKKKSSWKRKRGPRYLQSRPRLRQKARHPPPFAKSANSQAMISFPVLFSRMMTALLRSRMLRVPTSIVKIASLTAIQVSTVLMCPLITLTRVSCQLSALTRCILASRTSHSLLFPLSRRSRFSGRGLLELRLFDCPHTLLFFFRNILFENLVTFNSTLYWLLFLDALQTFAYHLLLTPSTRFPQAVHVFAMSLPSRDVKPDIAELERQASQEAPATPTTRPEKLNLTLSYGSQRESVYTPLQVSSSSGRYPTELRFALKSSAKARPLLHFRPFANEAFA